MSKTYLEEYEDFWKPIIEVDGVVNFDQVKRELYDFSNMINNVPSVYDHVTRGLISKPDADAQYVIDAFDRIVAEYEDRCCRNCEFFEYEHGKQPDGLDWEKIDCGMGIWSAPMDIDVDKISCSEFENKKD